MASSIVLLCSDDVLKEFDNLRTPGEGFHGQNQRQTSGSIRGQTAANNYEPSSPSYEHVVEGQSIFWTPTYPSLNQTESYMIGDDCSYRYFRRKSNPLFVKCSDFDQPQNHSFRCSCKYGFLTITVCILIALSVTLTCWIYGLNLENELKHLRDEMGSMKNSSLQNEEDIRFLKEQTGQYFGQCQYRTKERGNSNVIEFTLTDLVPDMNDAKNGVVTGVHCVVEGGTTAILRFTGTQYACNCTGKTIGDSRFCKIHYWYCPKIILG